MNVVMEAHTVKVIVEGFRLELGGPVVGVLMGDSSTLAQHGASEFMVHDEGFGVTMVAVYWKFFGH